MHLLFIILGSGGSAVPTGLNTLAFDDDVKCGRIKVVIHRYEESKLYPSLNNR